MIDPLCIFCWHKCLCLWATLEKLFNYYIFSFHVFTVKVFPSGRYSALHRLSFQFYLVKTFHCFCLVYYWQGLSLFCANVWYKQSNYLQIIPQYAKALYLLTIEWIRGFHISLVTRRSKNKHRIINLNPSSCHLI